MKFVEPIRDRKKIAQIKNLLRGQQRYRDLLFFVIGINTALRISDLLQLRLSRFLLQFYIVSVSAFRHCDIPR